MKKLFIFLFVLIFLISFSSAGSCSVSGYTYCWEDSNSYGAATATAKVAWRFEDNKGTLQNLNYAIGNLYVKSYDLSEGFLNRQWDSIWNSYDCNSNGCSISGYSTDFFFFPNERIKIANKGELFSDCLVVAEASFKRASNGDWAWVTTGYGWVGSGNCLNIKVVECSENTDCSSGETCDKSGDWTTWNCKVDQCKYVTCEDKCQNSIKYSDGYCSNGECNYQTENCDYGCSGNLCAQDFCLGVTCDDKCENSIWSYNGNCVNGECVYQTENCLYGCEDEPFLSIIVGEGMCRDDSCAGVTCEDYCSEQTLFHSGKCIGGECKQFIEKNYAEECAKNIWYKNTWLWVGIVSFIMISIFGIMYWRRR